MSCFCPRLTPSPPAVTLVSSPCSKRASSPARFFAASRGFSSSSDSFWSVRVAVDDVVADRAGEQERLLKDEADLLRALLRCNRSDVAAVEQHAAAGRIVEPRHQRRGGGLAAAGRSDQRVGLAALERERRVAQHRLSPPG